MWGLWVQIHYFWTCGNDRIDGNKKRLIKGNVWSFEIENLLNTLEIKWQSEGSEIQSSVIWDDVLELLKDKYPVPYVRFSSVYKSFSTLDDFKQLIW